jgi:peptide/nickel transport system permease protein
VFWTGQVLIIIVAVKLRLLPVGGMTAARETSRGLAFALDVARHLVLPAVTLALPLLAVVTSVCRASLRDAMREPFVQAARARGLSHNRVVMRHAAPHATVALATVVGQHAPQIVAGAALTEWLFGWPGLGTVVLEASLHRDYPLVTSSFLVIASTVVFFNAATDAVCTWLEPRIRLT